MIVVWIFFTMPRVCLQFVIVVFLDHTHFLFLLTDKYTTRFTFLISCLPGLALRTHVESLGKPSDSTGVLKALPGKLDNSKYSPSIFYV